jgi:hypothetical protein
MIVTIKTKRCAPKSALKCVCGQSYNNLYFDNLYFDNLYLIIIKKNIFLSRIKLNLFYLKSDFYQEKDYFIK